MPPSTPFVDRDTGALDIGRILAETIPIAKLIGLFVAIALVPLVLGFVVSTLGFVVVGLFTLLTQFVLAVGTGVVLLYVVSRAIQLADG